jgi:glyoxylase-like metal-dependent hydrolase (beta-lactamase superfamily II)
MPLKAERRLRTVRRGWTPTHPRWLYGQRFEACPETCERCRNIDTLSTKAGWHFSKELKGVLEIGTGRRYMGRSEFMGDLSYQTFILKRPGLTQDVPPGLESLEWVANTATLICGERDAVLVDTFLTIEQNQELIDWLRQQSTTLTHVFVTHGHGDHFFGVKQILEAFPDARAVATAGTVERAKREGSPEFLGEFWNARFPGQIPQPQVFPEPLPENRFWVEGHEFQAIESGFTDTSDSAALWVPDLRLLVVGDVGYNGIHQYQGEADHASRLEWIAAVERLIQLDPEYVVAGHKRPELADDPRCLPETRQYLLDLNRLETQTSSALELYHAMLELHPDRANPGSLWGAAKRAKPTAP